MKNITRERLIDITSQLEGIARELMEASEAPAPNPRKTRKRKSDERVAYHFNKIQKKIKR